MRKVEMIVMSHLNDAMLEMHMESLKDQAYMRLRFVKYLIFHYPDTTVEIDVKAEFKKFQSEESVIENLNK